MKLVCRLMVFIISPYILGWCQVFYIYTLTFTLLVFNELMITSQISPLSCGVHSSKTCLNTLVLLLFPHPASPIVLVFLLSTPQSLCVSMILPLPQYAMVCDRAWLRAAVQSMFMVGMLVGSYVLGDISDRWAHLLTLLLYVEGWHCGVVVENVTLD